MSEKSDFQEHLEGWFTGRLPADWFAGPIEVTFDRDEILVFFPHADDATRAELDSRVANGAERVQPIFEGMGRADFGVEAFAGVQVVIDPVDTGGLELLGLVRSEQTETDADVQPVSCLDLGDDLGDVGDFPVGGTA